MAQSAILAEHKEEMELVERAKADEVAFSELYNLYFPKIYGYIFRRVGSHEDAEDLTSQVFLKAFDKLGTFNYQGYSFSSWIFRIATNALTDHYRKKSRRKELNLDGIAEPSADTDLENEVNIIYKKAQVNIVLTRLSDKYQKVLTLKFYGQMEYEEIAETLNISVNNSRVLLHRALKKFDQEYSKYVQT
ncbi:RNA polymerase sigma factor [Candidatus Nomurabacteria bacterium]|nr:RNA polymerase sigma factor [Candidatus Nomurabacteria bacterium]